MYMYNYIHNGGREAVREEKITKAIRKATMTFRYMEVH